MVVFTVAAVPNDTDGVAGSTAPDPSTSHALSAAAAMTGRPAGSPVASAAAALISPSRSVGWTSSGSHAASRGATVHDQCEGFAQANAL
jgi:hypothetical protein